MLVEALWKCSQRLRSKFLLNCPICILARLSKILSKFACKRFRDKLFNNDGDELSTSGKTSSSPHGALEGDLSALRSKGSVASLKHDESGASFSNRSLPLTPTSFSKKHGAGGAIPPVQVSRQAALVPTQLGPSPSSSRRKSTPAALDMALRTAEGKAAIADLLNVDSKQGKKPMAFAQYFGAPGSKAASAAPGSSSPRGAADAPRAPLSVRMGLGAKPGSGLRPPDLAVASSGSSKSLANVPEDEDAATSVPSPPPVSHCPCKVLIPHMINLGFMLLPQNLSSAEAEDNNHPGRKNKVLALSPNLPASMARKFWSLSDYSIGRKMYTGYASTVYQVRDPTG